MFELSNYKDVDDISLPLINQFYALRDSGNHSAAKIFLETNKEILMPCMINAESLNKIERWNDYIKNLVYNSQKFIISDTEPDAAQMNAGSIWLQEYE